MHAQMWLCIIKDVVEVMNENEKLKRRMHGTYEE